MFKNISIPGLLVLALFLSLAMAGCSRQGPPRQAETPAPKPRAAAATVTFAKGEVRAFSEASWKPLGIGFELEAGDSLALTEGAQAELKGADGRLAKLAGPARGTVAGLMSAASVPERSAASKAATKIRKLEGSKQTYSVQTPPAVAGIRGTKARAAVPDTAKKDSLPDK